MTQKISAMKKILLLLSFVLALSACNKENEMKTSAVSFDGEWSLIQVEKKCLICGTGLEDNEVPPFIFYYLTDFEFEDIVFDFNTVEELVTITYDPDLIKDWYHVAPGTYSYSFEDGVCGGQSLILDGIYDLGYLNTEQIDEEIVIFSLECDDEDIIHLTR